MINPVVFFKFILVVMVLSKPQERFEFTHTYLHNEDDCYAALADAKKFLVGYTLVKRARIKFVSEGCFVQEQEI